MRIEDITDVQPIALKQGHSFVVEAPLQDKTNENSCNISYFEVGAAGDDLKKKLTLSIIMQFLKEPFFNALRTQQ